MGILKRTGPSRGRSALLRAWVICLAGFAAMPAMAEEAMDKIAVLTSDPANDYGFNQQGVVAAEAVAKKRGLEILIGDGLGFGDIRPTLREMAEEGADLIIAHSSSYNTAAAEVSKEIGVPVAVLDLPSAQQPGQIADYTLSGHEGAFLAGQMAALMTTTGTVAVVVSGEPMVWNTQSAGFAQGVHYGNPKVKVIYALIGPNAYADAAAARRGTEQVIAAGADIIFGQGNGASFGMMQAVETTPSVKGGKVWYIDVIGDKRPLDKAGILLTSVLWDLESVYEKMLDDMKSGTFGTYQYQIGLADNSVRLLQTDHIPADVWEKVMATREGIVNGSVKVERVFEAAAARALADTVTE